MVTETLASDARRALQWVDRELSVRRASLDAVSDVKRLIAAMPEQPDGRLSLRDRYTRNLLEALCPDEYGKTPPPRVQAHFHKLWDRLGLEGVSSGAACPEPSAHGNESEPVS